MAKIERGGDRKTRERELRETDPWPYDYKFSDNILYLSGEMGGGSVFKDPAPGVLGIGAHFSLWLGIKQDPPEHIWGALAEFHTVSRHMYTLRCRWEPTDGYGTQDPEWPEEARIRRAILGVAERLRDDIAADYGAWSPASLDEVRERAANLSLELSDEVDDEDVSTGALLRDLRVS